MAYVGSSPGKTIHINYFLVDETAYLVDLPGYGYAKVSQSEKARWAKLMEQYFAAGLISLGIFIVDARHAPTKNDINMAKWFQEAGCPFVILANKLDKLRKREILRGPGSPGHGHSDPLLRGEGNRPGGPGGVHRVRRPGRAHCDGIRTGGVKTPPAFPCYYEKTVVY